MPETAARLASSSTVTLLTAANVSATRRAVCTNILHFPARVVVTSEHALPLSIVLQELSGARERPMIISHADHSSLAAALRPQKLGGGFHGDDDIIVEHPGACLIDEKLTSVSLHEN